MSVEEFWSVTPAEFNGFASALARKRDSDIELSKAAAYWTEALHRTKRLPDFDRWMKPPKPARSLTGDEAARRLQEHKDDTAMVMGLLASKSDKDEEGHQGDG
jgi:hypothetical protein